VAIVFLRAVTRPAFEHAGGGEQRITLVGLHELVHRRADDVGDGLLARRGPSLQALELLVDEIDLHRLLHEKNVAFFMNRSRRQNLAAFSGRP
jgi:hypothetical protein